MVQKGKTIHPISRFAKQISAASEVWKCSRREGLNVNLEELEGDAGDEGETERKVYAPGFRSELSSYGRTGASRRPMRLHEFQVSPFFPTEGGRRSMDMRYATLSGPPAPPPPPPPMWSSRRSSAATVADDDGACT